MCSDINPLTSPDSALSCSHIDTRTHLHRSNIYTHMQGGGGDGWGERERVWNTDSQFDGFVPHDDVAWESEGLHVDNVDVSSFCADVKPFALEGQVAVCDPARGDEETITTQPGFSLSRDSFPLKSRPLITLVQLERVAGE